MSKVVNIAEQIAPSMRARFNVKHLVHYIEKGGRSSTKTSFASLVVAEIVANPMILGSGVSIRKYHNKVGKTVFKESIRACNRMGLKKGVHYKATSSPAKIVFKGAADKKKHQFTGHTIYFTGADNIDDTKGIIDENVPIKVVYIDEVTEFFKKGYEDGKEQLQNIVATFARGNNDWFKIIYTFNPPKNKKHPIYKWLDDMALRNDTMINHTTYRDVPPEWIGKVELANIAELKRVDYDAYQNTYLGIATGVKELVYGMFSKERHIMKERPRKNQLRKIVISIDHGQMNAFVASTYGWNPYKKKVQGLHQWSYSGRDEGKVMTDSEYQAVVVRICNEIKKVYGNVDYIVIDPSAAGFKEEMRRATRVGKINATIRNAKNDVALGISRTQKCLTFNIIEFDECMTRTLDEIEGYKWDLDKLDKGVEQPVKEYDHAMDELRYVIMFFWKDIAHSHPALNYNEK